MHNGAHVEWRAPRRRISIYQGVDAESGHRCMGLASAFAHLAPARPCEVDRYLVEGDAQGNYKDKEGQCQHQLAGLAKVAIRWMSPLPPSAIYATDSPPRIAMAAETSPSSVSKILLFHLRAVEAIRPTNVPRYPRVIPISRVQLGACPM
jgi:hypothetical protein